MIGLAVIEFTHTTTHAANDMILSRSEFVEDRIPHCLTMYNSILFMCTESHLYTKAQSRLDVICR